MSTNMHQNNTTPEKYRGGLNLLMKLSAQGKNIFTIGEAASAAETTPHQVKTLLYRLVKKGWLKHIERGKYLIVPLEAGIKREWSEDVFVIGSYLISPYTIAYWSALSYWNLTEQIPKTVFIQTVKRKGQRNKQILGISYRFIIVKPYKFFGITQQWFGQRKINITDIEKTIVDCLDRPELCGGIGEVSKGIWIGWKDKNIDMKKIVNYSLAMKNKAIIKRLGYICETFGIGKKPFWDKVTKKISGGYAYLDSSLGYTEYARNPRWRLIVNISTEALTNWRRT